MKTKAILAIVFIVVFTALSSVVMAGNPKEKDRDFLLSDPDNDTLLTWEEFVLGTDPFSTDSDNDGLPDDWEYEYRPDLDPADPSDAHLDADYDSKFNLSGYEFGEQDSKWNFRAIKKSMDVWPCDHSQTYFDVTENEDGPHYDNYEEYYRRYFLKDTPDIIFYIHTDPTDPDTDDDDILDPDDFRPLEYDNDSVVFPAPEIPTDDPEVKEDAEGKLKFDKSLTTALKPLKKDNFEENFDIHIFPYNEDKYSKSQSAIEAKDDHLLPDLDTDGI